MQFRTLYDRVNQGTEREFPSQLIHELVDEIGERNPESIAVLADGQSQTYAELRKKSDELAQYLSSLGVQRGDLVGLCCERRLDMPSLLLGIMKSGAGYVPLDPEYPADRLAFMVENSEVKHIIAHSNQTPLTDSFGVPTTIVDQDWATVAAACECSSEPKSAPKSRIDAKSDVAYVIYTSGSTGKPKGVLVPHRSVVNFLWSLQDWPGFTSQDRILATTTLSFDISVLEVFLPLVSGGSLAIVDRETAKNTPALVQAMQEYEVNCVQATPAMWRMVVEDDFAGRPDMKFISGGEPLPRDLIGPLLERCGELWNLYGPTETTVWSTGAKIESDEDRILIGRPFANTQVYIVDENDQLCSPDTPGELLIAGEGVTLGYLKRPELTAEKFCTWNGISVYRTGDLAQLTEDGQIDHLGRMDSQIKFHGHRIELGEIDAALAKQAGVRQAATVLREDRPGDKRLVGYLLAHEDESPNIADIRERIATMLPAYMVPNTIVVVDAFKYTPSGKLDRKAFDPPSTARPSLDTEFVAPASDEETKLAEIWCDVLQIDEVGILDNFLELGGSSIRAAAIVGRIQEEMDVSLTPGEFFDNPTIQSLVGLAERKQELLASLGQRGHRKPAESNAYAIVGMAARMPGAGDLNEYWDNLVAGTESIRFFRHDELDPTLDPRDTSSSYVPARGIVDAADHFDAKFFKTPPRHAELMDPQQRILLELSWSALEDAGIIPSKSEDTIGVWAGSYTTTYFTKNILSNPELVRETGEFNLGIYNEKDYIATRIAHALNLTGPAINVNTACSTSLVALIEACKSLSAGDCDVALAGGASIHFPQHSGHVHQTDSIFSPDGHCRPFDSEAAGTMFSDGAGLVVVKRLDEALRDQDRIYAVVKGYGINNDGGNKASFSAPSIRGQASAIAMAHAMGEVHPETIGYIEAHGTATPLGDPIEVAALRTVFEAKTEKKQFCALGSVKSNIGHTVAAAGVAGLIKVAMSLHTEQIPATLHYQRPNPQIDFENSSFFVCDHLKEWKRTETPRRAGVSSFGVGGTNAHIVIEEAPDPRPEPHSSNELPVAILPVSAISAEALQANVDQLACDLEQKGEDTSLAEVAATLQLRRGEFLHRAVVVAQSVHEAAGTLQKKKAPAYEHRKANATQRDIAFMFPGQGAQYVRMGQDLYSHSQVFREHLDRCAEILRPLLDRDLRQVLFPPPGDEDASQEILKNTQFTQPALFAMGYSLAQVWLTWGVRPAALMGHSIGEFAAACTAGVFSLEDGLKMIAERGRAMQALPGGSMLSVRLPGADVEPMLSSDMAIGSYNGPNLCVVAGPTDQVTELQKRLEDREVVCRHLHTSHAFHSPMMDSIVQPFAEFISQFRLHAPKIPILSTVTGSWLTDEEAQNPDYWAQHLRAPVRFSEAVTRMWDRKDGDPNRILVELGPRKTLATLARQHASEPKQQVAIPSLSDKAEDNAEWQAILLAVAKLWLCGVPIDWSLLSSDGQPRKAHRHVPLPTYRFQSKRFFIEPTLDTRSPSVERNVDRPSNAPVADVSSDANPVAADHAVRTQLLPDSAAPHQEEPSIVPSLEPIVSRLPAIIDSVQQVFENTSGVDLNDYDGDTTFFEMGLDSLALTQTAAALKAEMGMEVTFRQLLENTTDLDSLAAWFDEELEADKFATLPQTPEVDVAPSQDDSSPNVATQIPTTHVENQASLNSSQASWEATNQSPLLPPPAAVPLAQSSVPQGAIENVIQMQLQAQMQLMQQQMQLLGAVSGETTEPTATRLTPQPSSPDQPAVEKASAPQALPVESNNPTSKATSPASEDADAPATPKAKRFKTVKLTDGDLDAKQQAALDDIIQMNNSMLPKSKAYAQEHRKYLADPRTVSGFRPNMKEMTHPIVVERSKGVHLWDIDGHEYIDFTCGFGSNFLGHGHEITVQAITEQVQKDYAIGPQSPLAGEVARLFCELTGHERMAFSNTGSEAVLGCTRLARNYTGRDTIVMFNGDYHGILDEVIARGSKKLKSFPAATGIPKDYVGKTLILDYGSDESLHIIRENMDQLAAILVEPVQSRKPELQPREFLQELSRMTSKEPTALIFDEVITGLRIGLGGAQEFFGVQADLASYGKVVGGGMPIGVMGGKAKYMDGLDGGYWEYGDDSRPEAGMTYFAGTFVRHPLTLAASKAIMLHLKAGGQPMYDRVNQLADYLADEMNRLFEQLHAPLHLANFGSLFKIQFEQELVYSEIFFAGLRRRGMHIWDHRPCLLTLAHEKEHIDEFVHAMQDTIIECQRHGFMPGDGFEQETASASSCNRPPLKGAHLGKDSQGNAAWFVPDSLNPGQFIQVGFTN